MTTPAENAQSMTPPTTNTSSQNLVEARALSFSWGDRVIYNNLNLLIRRGQVTGIMGPSGTGKTTLLKLIGGQLTPDSGQLLLNGRNIADMSRSELFEARASMGMLFQSGALFTDMTVFENVAFPLRAHTDLSETLIREVVGLKLEAVGLRGTEDLMPAELSGGMNRRVALARAIALDPELIMYDEPFAGQDPIVMGVLVRLIRSLRDALGLTTVIVSHDVTETLSISDYVYVVADGQVMGEGTPDELRNSTSPFVQQFLRGEADGPVTFQYSQEPYLTSATPDGAAPTAAPKKHIGKIQQIGRDALDRVEGIGAAGVLLARSAFGFPSLSGLGLFTHQMYRVGVLSLLIILVSGLFIGLVLGLQGFTILSKYGSAQALGTMVSLTLVRELGPVITALLFAGRAGSALTAEIGLMKATEQLASMEMIGVDPLRRIVAPRLWSGILSLPMLAIIFSAIGIIGGKMVGVDWLGVDQGSFWNSMQGNVNFVDDVVNGIIKSVVFGVVCTWIAVYQGYAAVPTSEGISTATTNTVVYSSLCVLGLDFILTAVMFGGLS